MSRVVGIAVSGALGLAVLFLWPKSPAPSTPEGNRVTAPAIEEAEAPVEEAEPDEVAEVSPLADSRETVSTAAAPVVEAPQDEPLLMELLRSTRDPEMRVRLAREGNRRFPNTSDAPERSSILIHALADLGRSSEARGEAETMVNGSPDSEWVREIEQFTGAKRHRNVRLNDAGELEYYE